MARERNSGKRLARTAAAFGILALVAGPAAADNPDAIAVIVGNAEYRNPAWNAPSAANDARAVAEFATRRLGFREDRVFVLNNATGTDLNTWFGTRDYPEGKLHNRVRADRSDVLVFYAGHGMPDVESERGSERGYLLSTDADPGRVHLGGYPIDLLLENLKALPARSVLVALDACFSGATEAGILTGALGTVNFSLKPVRSARMAILTAAKGHQTAYADADSGHGVFTDQLLAGLGGMADRNGNGEVTLGEIETWLDKAVPRRVREMNGREQTPDIHGDRAMVLAALPPDTLTVRAAQAGARIRVAGGAYRAGMPVGRGEHEVTVEAQGHERYSGRLAVDGPTEYRIDLCRVESRTERICEDEEVTEYRTETVEEVEELYVREWRDVPIGEALSMIEARMRGMSHRDILNIWCDPENRYNVAWKAVRELKDDCEDDYDGRLRRGSVEVEDCDCDYEFADLADCEAEVIGDCVYKDEERVPYTTIRQVCRDEQRSNQVCPPRIVERLR